MLRRQRQACRLYLLVLPALLLWALCAQAAPRPASPGLPATAPKAAGQEVFASLFGHATLPATSKDFPVNVEEQWQRVLAEELASPSLELHSSRLPPVDARHWLYFVSKAKAMDETGLLRGVNAFFNKYQGVSDQKNYQQDEYWAGPAEFFARGAGDCEEYALAKYFALRALGIADEKMRILLVYDVKNKANHALLAVAISRGVYILDNNVRPKELILPQNKFVSVFVPLYALNASGRWTFAKNGTGAQP